MVDFQTAFKAGIPFVGVHTDDPVHVLDILAFLTDRKTHPFSSTALKGSPATVVLFTEDLKTVTTEHYRALRESHRTCVVINGTASSLVFDTGTLETPSSFVEKFLTSDMNVDVERIPALLEALKGLSLKTVHHVVQIAMARYTAVSPELIRKVRSEMEASSSWLTPLDTSYTYYQMPQEIQEWMDLNKPYMVATTPMELMPRGLMLTGDPGTGKTMAARVIAHTLDLPLYRIDIAASLSRFIGVAETRVQDSLTVIEKAAPCVWLLDEVEKLFVGKDEATSMRILGQLLWWLQYHSGLVLTIMTTNNLELVPKELYRPERLDRVVTLPLLNHESASTFGVAIAKSLFKARGKKLTKNQEGKVLSELYFVGKVGWVSHAEVKSRVVDLIKAKEWL